MSVPRMNLRITTPAATPLPDAPEGLQARWFREHRLNLSRPALAARLGISANTVERTEQLDVVPAEYRLACMAIYHRLDVGFLADSGDGPGPSP